MPFEVIIMTGKYTPKKHLLVVSLGNEQQADAYMFLTDTTRSLVNNNTISATPGIDPLIVKSTKCHVDMSMNWNVCKHKVYIKMFV